MCVCVCVCVCVLNYFIHKIWRSLLIFFLFFDFIKNTSQDGNKFIILMWPVLFFFLKKLLLCNVSYIELFTRKI